jgi:hypothetical protein
MSLIKQGQVLSCENCMFWKNYGDDEGWCRRYAPRPFVKGDKFIDIDALATYWPETLRFEFCGEHSLKEGSTL